MGEVRRCFSAKVCGLEVAVPSTCQMRRVLNYEVGERYRVSRIFGERDEGVACCDMKKLP
jgi:hypothetical protein